MSSLQGGRAIVTGASRGIGRGIALAFAAAGADVALMARDEDGLEAVAAEIRALGRQAHVLPVDVTDQSAVGEAVSAAVEGLGGLDVLVNNAGGNSFSAPFAHMRTSGWDKTQALNVNSVVYVTQAAAPHLLDQSERAVAPSVINMASVAGIGAVPLMSHYGAAKAAVVSLTKTLAVEWAWAGVRVNALLPGWIATDLTEFLRDNPDGEQAVLARVPMARWGQVEDIAEPAVFLASSAAKFITGQVLVADGGLTVMP